jgi:hypothetical protein
VRHHPALTAPLNGDNGDSVAHSRSSSTGASAQRESSSGDGGSGGGATGESFAFPCLADTAANGSSGAAAADPDSGLFSFAGPLNNGGGGGGGVGGAAAHVAIGAPDAGYVASRRLLMMAGVTLRQHRLKSLVVVNPT